MTSSGGNHSIANTRPRFASNRKTGPEEGLRGGRAERNDQIRTYYLDLGVQPGPARADLDGFRFVVHSALPPPYELEMLDDIGYIDIVGRKSGSLHRFVQDASRRPNTDGPHRPRCLPAARRQA